MKVYIFSKKLVAVILAFVLLLACVFIYFSSFRQDVMGVFFAQKKLPIYSVETEERKISISFDAAWGDEFTDEILDILDKYNVKTTFFLVGFWVDRYPDMVKKISDRGHEIGNHSTTHPHMSKLSREQIISELNTTGEKIEKITGIRPTVFRPPFGDYNDLLIDTAQEIGYYTIQWDVDSLDWREMGVQPVVDRVTRNVRKGSIVLFHNNARYVSQFLPSIIEKLQAEGYQIVPVSELLIKEDYTIDSSGRQKSK